MDKPEPILRQMTEADIGAVSALEQQCFSIPWSEGSLRFAVESPLHHAVVLTVSEEVAGFAICAALFEECEIMDIAVAENARRQGYGALLMDELLRFAADAGCTHALLEVRESNLPARALYRKKGFSVYGRRGNYYHRPTEDALLMRWEKEAENASV